MSRLLIAIGMAGLILAPSGLAMPTCVAAEPARNTAELLERFSSVKYDWQQRDVAEELIQRQDKSVLSAMEPFLKSERRGERCNAGLVLAGLGDKRGAAIILGEFNDKQTRPTEMRRSDNKPDPVSQIRQDRYYAALLLGRLKETSAVPDLIAALQDETVNYRAAISLGEIGDRRALHPLLIMTRESTRNRLWAGYGLARLGEEAGFDILVETLSDSHWVQRRHAVEAIGNCGESRMAPHLIKALQDERVQVRVSAAVSLGKIGDASAVEALETALRVSEVNRRNERGLIDEADLTHEGYFLTAANDAVKLIHARTKPVQ